MTRKFARVSKYDARTLELPKRATKAAAGYDFQAAEDFLLPSIWRLPFLKILKRLRQAETVVASDYQAADLVLKPLLVPTGIKVYMEPQEFLLIANRSSNPLKRGLYLPNGVGIIDADYVDNAANEGEIFIQMINFGLHDRLIKKGERIGQGIFMPYLLTDDDEKTEKAERTGGFGSSGMKWWGSIMAKTKTQFVCSNCGAISQRYMGRCPNCGAWGTLVEEVQRPEKADRKSRVNLAGQMAKVERLNEVDLAETPRIATQLAEFDRVLGGGIVPGSLVLIGGDPGIGKSTLLLQVSGALSKQGRRILYVSGEESAAQIKLRAERLGVDGESEFYLYPETDMGQIRKAIDEAQPDLVVIDSIQTMQQPDVQSAVGSVAQIRETTADLLQIAKTNNITIFIVGHVTKEGTIAGPKILEHMVDTVLYFEGDNQRSFRLLRAEKNRFGSTNELGVFEMVHEGLAEVTNPSEMFLEERLADASGSAVVVALEGTRPVLVEIQALVTPTVFGNAQRTAAGIDRNRVSVLMAVLEKRANLLLQNQDAYVRAAGGVKLDEPALDLALAVAIASSYRDQGTRPTDAFIGEIGLTGELRRVPRIKDRVLEAQKLGFKRVFLPKQALDASFKGLSIDLVGVKTLSEALEQALA